MNNSEMFDADAMFTDLTEEETAALNGGYHCYYFWVLRCYWYYYRRICRYVRYIRCYY